MIELSFPFDLGQAVYVDAKTLPTHRIDELEKKLPKFFEAEIISVRKNKNGCFFKLSVRANWLHQIWDDECGPYEAGVDTTKSFTYPKGAIGKTVFLQMPK